MLNRRHIKAPKTFDPGRGAPRERLAYMSPAEMEMLRVLTDGVVEKGPKGIPSFAVTTGKTTTQPSLSSSQAGAYSQAYSSGYRGSSAANYAASSNNVTGSTGNRGSSNSTSTGSSATKSPASSAPRSSTTQAAAKAAAPSAPSAARSSTTMASRTAAKTSAPAPVSSNFGGAPRSSTTMAAAKPSAMAPSTASAPRFAGTQGQSYAKGGSTGGTTTKTASALTAPQKQAYTQYGQSRLSAPVKPSVPRTPGDAERMARMAMAESGLIRDAGTGKMNMGGALGVMNVIRNRMENQDETVGGVISQKSQFSPWGDGKYSLVKADPAYTALANQVLQGNVLDNTRGADFYHNTSTVNGGYSTASAGTKDRINNNFVKTFEANDGVKPGVYGHQFGIAADGTNAVRRGTQAQKVLRGGTADAAEPARPVTGLPSGIFGSNPEDIGRTPLTGGDMRRVPGRFSAPVPGMDGGAEKVAYRPGQPVDTAGAMAEQGTVPMTFANQPGRISKGKPDGLKPAVMSAWQQTLNAFGESVPIVSGHRDPVTNKAAGGAKKSQHLSGNAIDVDVSKLSIPQRQNLIREAMRSGFQGVGVYTNSLHFDMGNRRAWGPSKHADSVPSWAKGALNGEAGSRTASGATATPQRQATAWGLPGAMQAAGNFLANPPSIDLRSGLDAAGRAIKQYADTGGGMGFQRAIADTYIKNAVAPKVRDAFSSGMGYLQSFLAPRPPAAMPGGGNAPSAAGPWGSGSQTVTPSAPGPVSRSQFPSDSSNFGSVPLPPEMAQAVAAAIAAPAPVGSIAAAPDYSYFTNVKTREQALRDLLGKEWFA